MPAEQLPDDDLSLIRQALAADRGEDQRRIAAAGLSVVATLLKKNADYGSSAWTRPVTAPHLPARTAILVRMADKVNRIGALQNKPPEVAGESLSDTVLDLAGYAILYDSCPDEIPHDAR